MYSIAQWRGRFGNKNNLYNLLKKRLLNNEQIIVKDVYRSLIDIDDLKLICDNCIHLKNEIVSVCYIEKIKVIEIVNIIANLLNIEPNIKMMSITENLHIENSFIVNEFLKNKTIGT